MRGHHHESCTRRATQQGELVGDTSRAPGQRATAGVRGFFKLKRTPAPEVLIDRNVTCNNAVATARCFSICCGATCTRCTHKLRRPQYEHREADATSPSPKFSRTRRGHPCRSGTLRIASSIFVNVVSVRVLQTHVGKVFVTSDTKNNRFDNF